MVAETGCLVAVCDEAGETVVRRIVDADGGRVLRACGPGCTDRVLDDDTEVLIRGVVVFRGRKI